MRFFVASLFAFTALAAPTNDMIRVSPRAQAMEAALDHIHDFQAASCSIIKCVTALAPTFVGCGAAAAEEFANPVADLSCIAAAVNDGVNPPAPCTACFEAAKNATGIGSREVTEGGVMRKRVYLMI